MCQVLKYSKTFLPATADAAVSSALVADVTVSLLDHKQGIGGVKNGNPMKMLQVAQMLIARHDKFDLSRKRGRERLIIIRIG